jgi:glycosyltransferase involved in cell wall biosynthesis
MRRKVLFLIPFFTVGGAERVLLTLLCHLDRNRFEPHLGLLQAKGEFMGDIPKDVVIHDLRISRVRYALPSIVRLAWKVKPDVILSTLAHLNLALISSRFLLPRGTRLLIREAVVASASIPQETRHPRVWEWLYRRLYKRADKIVCLSDSMVRDLIERFDVPTRKIVRIYNPVDIAAMRQLAGNGKSPYSGSGPHLIAAGRLCRQKGFDVLVNAMPAIVEHLPNARLTILGEGPLRVQLTEQVQRLGLAESVHFLGFRSNPWPYFKHADLFVLPSRYEGLPNVLLEARACGVPAVATDCPGGTREIADIDSRVHLVPTEDVGAIASAIVSLCKVTRNIRQDAEEPKELIKRFGVQVIVDDYSSLLSI